MQRTDVPTSRTARGKKIAVKGEAHKKISRRQKGHREICYSFLLCCSVQEGHNLSSCAIEVWAEVIATSATGDELIRY